MINETFDYVEYLKLKKSIDDRSLNSAVWNELVNRIKSKCQNSGSIFIVEPGAGIGTMITRIMDELLKTKITFKCAYTAIEPEPGFQTAAESYLQAWAEKQNAKFIKLNEQQWQLSKNEMEVTVDWECAAAEDFSQVLALKSVDLLLAHALVDLLPVPELVPDLMQCLKADGIFYFSLNYSGQTEFSPGHQSDSLLMQEYNADMDKRFPDLDWQASHTGNLLPDFLQKQGHTIISEGSSDWELDANEKAFILNILDTIKKALSSSPGIEQWYAERRDQLEHEKLKLKISNRDLLGEV